jgi:hypothetical protein
VQGGLLLEQGGHVEADVPVGVDGRLRVPSGIVLVRLVALLEGVGLGHVRRRQALHMAQETVRV